MNGPKLLEETTRAQNLEEKCMTIPIQGSGDLSSSTRNVLSQTKLYAQKVNPVTSAPFCEE